MSEVLPIQEVEQPNLEFPAILGNEEETFMQVKFKNKWRTPYDLTRNLEKYLPDDISHAGIFHYFLSNGGKIYVGGVSPDYDAGLSGNNDNIERATPECTTPLEAATYIDAHDLLIRNVAQKYAIEMARKNQHATSVVIHRRVVDSAGNRRGSHDNFSMDEPALFDQWPKYTASLVGHLVTRSIITGAGYVRDDGLRFAQKIGGLKRIEGYGYDGTMYRAVQNINGKHKDATGDRLEIRCNDINISPWATQIRLGSMALLLTAIQTELVHKISEFMPFNEDPLQVAKRLNVLQLTDDGSGIVASEGMYTAIDFQDRLADAFLAELEEYVDIPAHYYKIASELKQYCDDFRKVLIGEAALAILADRADFAAKFTKLQTDTDQQSVRGLVPDVEFQKRTDLKYDYIAITTEPDGNTSSQFGFGHRLKARQQFRMPIPQKDVQRAYATPPSATRAIIRGNAIKDFNVRDAHWDGFDFDKPGVKIKTLDPLQTRLSDGDQKVMDIHRKK